MRFAPGIRFLTSAVVLVATTKVSRAEFADFFTADPVSDTATGQVGAVIFDFETTRAVPPPDPPHTGENGGINGEPSSLSVLDGTATWFDSPNYTPPLAMADSLTLWAASDYRIVFSQPVTEFRLHIFQLANNTLSFTVDGATANLSLLSSDGDLTLGPGTVLGLSAGGGNPAGDDNASGTIAVDGLFSVISWTSSSTNTGDGISIQFSAVGVPEPSGITLIVVSAILLPIWRRNR